MKKLLCGISVVALLLLSASPSPAPVIGQFRFPGTCDGAADQIQGDRTELYAYNDNVGTGRILYQKSSTGTPTDSCAIIDGSGTYNCTAENWGTDATTLNAPKWFIVTSYGNTAAPDLNVHQGYFGLDGDPANGIYGTSEMMPIPSPYVIPGTPNTEVGSPTTFTGFDVRINPVPELIDTVDDWKPAAAAGCDPIGGTHSTDAERFVIGYNIWRVAGGGTPDDYLNGSDGDPNTHIGNGDAGETGGWVAFVPVETGASTGLNLTDRDTDNDPADNYGVDEATCDPNADIDGDTNPDPSSCPGDIANRPAVNLIFSHRDGGADAGDWTYTYQPVVRGAAGGDVNGTVDLDGDTTPEFMDPSGNGYGLTYGSMLLLSADSAATSGVALPAGGTVRANFSQTHKGFDLSFTASLEGQVAGYNVYRSTEINNDTKFARVNSQMIAADGQPLANYVFSDSVKLTGRRGGTYFYKIEAIMHDGSSQTFGPFEATFTATGRSRHSR